MKQTLKLCIALGFATAGNIFTVIAAQLFEEKKPKKAAITLPDESPWRAVVDDDFES